MGKWDQVSGSFGCTDPGDLGNRQNIPFLQGTCLDQGQSSFLHQNFPSCHSQALGFRFRTHIDHVHMPGFIQMSQFGRGHE